MMKKRRYGEATTKSVETASALGVYRWIQDIYNISSGKEDLAGKWLTEKRKFKVRLNM